MSFLQIFQIITSLPMIINTVEQLKGAGNGPVKREDVKRAVLSTTSTMEVFNALSIGDRKKFNKGLDKVVDGIVDMLNASSWKKG